MGLSFFHRLQLLVENSITSKVLLEQSILLQCWRQIHLTTSPSLVGLIPLSTEEKLSKHPHPRFFSKWQIPAIDRGCGWRQRVSSDRIEFSVTTEWLFVAGSARYETNDQNFLLSMQSFKDIFNRLCAFGVARTLVKAGSVLTGKIVETDLMNALFAIQNVGDRKCDSFTGRRSSVLVSSNQAQIKHLNQWWSQFKPFLYSSRFNESMHVDSCVVRHTGRCSSSFFVQSTARHRNEMLSHQISYRVEERRNVSRSHLTCVIEPRHSKCSLTILLLKITIQRKRE